MESRTPLSVVVANCTKTWFGDTLKEAKSGDSAMQVLVGQMYCSGYGVPADPKKGLAWIDKGSKNQSLVGNPSDNPPGYNANG